MRLVAVQCELLSPRRWVAVCLLLCALPGVIGCGPTEWLVRTDSLAPWLKTSPTEWVNQPLKPSKRTVALLGRLDLTTKLKGDPQKLLAELQQHLEREQTPDLLYAYAEIAFLAGQKIEPIDRKRAFDIYAASVAHAYLYLFDPSLTAQRNPFDPQFRHASDIYNKSLDRALRMIVAEGGLRPGSVHTCNALDHVIEVHVAARHTSWRGEEIDSFEFVSDYETTAIVNNYHTYGLGVPLMALRKRSVAHPDAPQGIEKFYPETLALPVTAILKLAPTPTTEPNSQPKIRATLELVDPLVENYIEVADRRIPIESDLTTPIAFGLNSMEFDDFTVSTFSMLSPQSAEHHHGLFMMEPYQPNKIPVVFVHGLWSSPVTWVEMFNDLRGDPEIRAKYQFWYYFYPSGQPFLFTATTLRQNLAELRQRVDPNRTQPSLDQMVLVGHSMGGLVSKMQSVDSGDEFWDRIAKEPLDKLDLDDPSREKLAEVFYFRANPSVRRVVTIATPHEGSSLSNSATQWLARTLFITPEPLEVLNNSLQNKHPGLFKLKHPFSLPTSIDTLSPDSPALAALRNRPKPPWVTYNNIYGEVEDDNWFSRYNGTSSDGVVPVESAKAPFAVSSVAVPASHQTIHRHPRTVLEMRRILKDHLAMLNREAEARYAQIQRMQQEMQRQLAEQNEARMQQERERAAQANPTPTIPLPQLPFQTATPGPQLPGGEPQRYRTVITGARPLPTNEPPTVRQ